MKSVRSPSQRFTTTQEDGRFFHNSLIYRETIDKATGQVVNRELNWKNHSEVMFDYALIPKGQIR